MNRSATRSWGIVRTLLPLLAPIVALACSPEVLVGPSAAAGAAGRLGLADISAADQPLPLQVYDSSRKQWGSSLTVVIRDTIDPVLFRWSVTSPVRMDTLPFWVADKAPRSNGSLPRGTTILAHGSAGAPPSPGRVRRFTIDLADFVPASPPDPPGKYWVFLARADAQGRPRPAMSSVVLITYGASD